MRKEANLHQLALWSDALSAMDRDECLGQEASDRKLDHAPWVYRIVDSLLRVVKIGTTTNISHRIRTFHTANAGALRIWWIGEGDKSAETKMHARFARDRIDPKKEWFFFDPIRDDLAVMPCVDLAAVRAVLREDQQSWIVSPFDIKRYDEARNVPCDAQLELLYQRVRRYRAGQCAERTWNKIRDARSFTNAAVERAIKRGAPDHLVRAIREIEYRAFSRKALRH